MEQFRLTDKRIVLATTKGLAERFVYDRICLNNNLERWQTL